VKASPHQAQGGRNCITVCVCMCREGGKFEGQGWEEGEVGRPGARGASHKGTGRLSGGHLRAN